MDFTFDMYFRQFWTDPRLSFDPVDFGINQLVVGSEYIRSDHSSYYSINGRRVNLIL